MTFKEIKEMFAGQYADIEIYSTTNVGEHYPNSFHTDNCNSVMENISDDTEIGLYELMDEEDYADSLCANSCIEADFEEWYGDKNAKVLCVMLA